MYLFVCLRVIKKVRTVFFNNYIAIHVIWMVNKQFGSDCLKNIIFGGGGGWGGGGGGSLLVTSPIHSSSTDVWITPVLLESREISRSLWKRYKLKIENYMHFQMFCMLGKLHNLYKDCFLKPFFFSNPATVGHLVNPSYNSIPEQFNQTRTIQASNWSVYWRKKRILIINQSVSKYWSCVI